MSSDEKNLPQTNTTKQDIYISLCVILLITMQCMKICEKKPNHESNMDIIYSRGFYAIILLTATFSFKNAYDNTENFLKNDNPDLDQRKKCAALTLFNIFIFVYFIDNFYQHIANHKLA